MNQTWERGRLARVTAWCRLTRRMFRTDAAETAALPSLLNGTPLTPTGWVHAMEAPP